MISILLQLYARLSHVQLPLAGAYLSTAIRWLSRHTGVPALLVAAVLVVVGYRLLKRSARFMVEVALVGAVLFVATELGWLHW